MCDLKFLRTEIRRTTLTQEIRGILGCGDEHLHRKVQVIIPQSPQVFIGIDIPVEDVGTNKTFNMPVMHPGQFLEFPLGPTQTLYGACSDGNALVTLVIELYQEQTR